MKCIWQTETQFGRWKIVRCALNLRQLRVECDGELISDLTKSVCKRCSLRREKHEKQTGLEEFLC